MTWWVVNGTGLVVMSLLGEYLCIKRELREIPITRLRSSKASFLREINKRIFFAIHSDENSQLTILTNLTVKILASSIVHNIYFMLALYVTPFYVWDLQLELILF